MSLPLSSEAKAKMLLANKVTMLTGFRDALAERKIAACIPSRINRKVVMPHDPAPKKRRKIEDMFGRLKDR